VKRAHVLLALAVVGLGVLAAPRLFRLHADWEAKRVVRSYDTQLFAPDGARVRDAWEQARAYNRALGGQDLADPFLSASVAPPAADYTRLLNVDADGLMATLAVPKLGLELPVYHGVGEDSLRRGVGHMPASALPVGGAGSHCVLVGHRGLATKDLFVNLDKLALGDRFVVTVLGRRFVYAVDRIVVVEPENTAPLRTERRQDWLTLVTCTPYGVNSHRLLVRGRRVPPAVAAASSARPASAEAAAAVRAAWWPLALLALLVAGALAVLLVWARSLRRFS
jgi:sortase A